MNHNIVPDWRMIFIAASALCLASCQKGLDPIVPAGSAAYDVISPVPVPGSEVTGRYTLGRGDVVSIAVFQEPELSRNEVEIDAAGNLDLPLIGQVNAKGLTTSELAQVIERSYAERYLRNPRVSVLLDEAVQQRVSVEGEVALPGVYPYREGQTLLSALAEARSPLTTAKLDEVLIFRTVDNRRMGGRFDVKAIREGRMDDPSLMPGDVVVVGFSQARGAFRDFLQLAPALGSFVFLARP